MTVCEKHNRWTRIERADGTVATRDCPECPHRRGLRLVNQFTRVPLLDEHGRERRVAMPREEK